MHILNYPPGLYSYPKMERQDLTQSQLGSFKFTPTDEVGPAIQAAPPELARRFAESLAQHSKIQQQQFVQPVERLNTEVRSQQVLAPTLPWTTQAAAAHFDDSTKPDLDVSRLRLGSAAFRAFMDVAATSPPKDRSYASSPRRQRLSDISQSMLAEVESNCRHDKMTGLRSTGSDLPLAVPDDNRDTLSMFHTSLIRALDTEQNARLDVQRKLEHEKVKRAEAESQVRILTEHNQSLLGSVNLLKSLVHHNMKREQALDVSSSRKKTPQSSSDETTSQFADDPAALSSLPERSIVQQDLPEQRTGHDSHNIGTVQESFDEHFSQTVQEPVDEDISQSGVVSSSVKSPYIATEPEIEDDTQLPESTATPLQEHISDPGLVSETGSSRNSATEHRGDSLANTVSDEVQNQDNDHASTSADQAQVAVLSSPMSSPKPVTQVEPELPLKSQFQQGKLWTTSDPIFRLPQSFLDKYQTSQSKVQQNLSRHQSLQNPFDPPVQSAISVLEKKQSSSESVADPISDDQESISEHDTTSSVPKPTDRALAFESMYDSHIDWKVTQEEPVFGNDNDKLRRLGHANDQSNLANRFYNHPVRYMPNKAERNLYRTVMVDFLPKETTYKELLAQVRTGSLESVHLYGPIGTTTDFMTARIVFHYERDAQALYRYGMDSGVTVRGQRARVWQVLQPTYPKSRELEAQVFDQGYTRSLIIDNANDFALAALPKKLGRQLKAGSIIEFCNAVDGLPLIEFTSVVEATKALRQLLADPDFGGTKFDFEDDPCAQVG